MSVQQISGYAIRETGLLKDTTLLDVSVLISEGPDVFDTRAAFPSTLKGLIASALAEDFGVGTERVIELAWNATAKEAVATKLVLKQVAGGKGGAQIQIKIGSSSGGDDILKLTTLQGYAPSFNYVIHINGITPEMFSDSDTFFLTLVLASSAANTTDIRLFGPDYDA